MRILAALLAFTAAASAPLVAAEPVVLVRCGRLIDGRGDQALTSVVVQVTGQRITAIGKDVPAVPGAQTIDLHEATCLPGLIDLHAHILINPGDVLADSLRKSSARKALEGLRNARVRLQNGFTTLRDPGDEDLYYSTIEIRDAIARGDFEGPRLFVAPHMISSTGGHGDFNDLAADLALQVPNVVVDGPDAMRKAVREEIKHGADWIKLAATGGVMSAADDPRAQAFTDEELRAAVDEAHRHGRKVTVHAIGTGGIKAALRAGVDGIEHGLLIDDEAIAMMKERGVTLVTTSNIEPSNLYRDGLQRAKFLPAIALLEQHCEVVQLLAPHDYRLRALTQAGIYFSPLGADAERGLDACFERLAPGSRRPEPEIQVNGRAIAVKRRADGVIWFDFAALCEGPRAVADYIELAQSFNTVLISDVPQFSPQMENAARRFVNLVDEFYDRGVNLVLSAAVPIPDLYRGERLRAEFARTQSRLIEMQSGEYLAREHR